MRLAPAAAGAAKGLLGNVVLRGGHASAPKLQGSLRLPRTRHNPGVRSTCSLSSSLPLFVEGRGTETITGKWNKGPQVRWVGEANL